MAGGRAQARPASRQQQLSGRFEKCVHARRRHWRWLGTEMTMKVRTDDGIAIEYQIYGRGPLTLLFLHGWGNAASAWDDFVTRRLNLSGLRCIAASYRGHGGSSGCGSGYTHERFARDMFAVVDAVGAERFV